MKKFFILVMALCVVASSAATVGAVKPAYTPPTNAYWQIIDDGGDNVLACVLEGDTVYGDGDDCRIFNTDTMDFTEAVELYLEFDISLVNDSANDHCLLQMRDADISSWTTLEDFTADTAGYEHRQYDLIGGPWGDWTEYDSVYLRFRWVSNESGTSDGVRINDAMVYMPGQDVQVEYLHWTSDHSAYGPGESVSLDMTDDLAGRPVGRVNHTFDDNDIWAWWCEVDQFELSDEDGREVFVDEDFESWPPTDWTITELGSPGQTWVSNSTTYRTNYAGYSGYCADCDSDYWYAGTAGELITPDVDLTDASEVYCYFIGAYNNIGGDEYWCYAEYELDPEYFISDDFEGDLALWTISDQGSGNVNIEERSFGVIKGMYR
jgi:hypothetical protein